MKAVATNGARSQRHVQGGLYAAGAIFLVLALLVLTYYVYGIEHFTLVVPVVGTAIGVALISYSGPAYIEYMLWMYFLTPFIRRIVDYSQGAYTPTSLIIATPLLIGAVSIIPFLYALVRGRVSVSSPIVIPLVALGFAFIVGLTKNGAVPALYDLLAWLVPIAIGFHLAQNWRRYPEYRNSVRRTFVLGGLVLGLYGIAQFVVLMPWDQFWMEGSGVIFGKPEAFKVRVFGTLNAPGPYAVTMMAAIAMIVGSGNVISLGPAIVGLLLSLVRAAWGGLFLAIVWLAGQARGRERTRLVWVIAVGVVVAVPFLRFGPIGQQVGERASTISALDENRSAQARAELYTGHGVRWVLQNPLGRGLGSIGKVSKLSQEGVGNFDSGILGVPLVLGIPGMLIYYFGLGTLVMRYVWRRHDDWFLQVASGLVLSIIALLLFANQLANFAGVILWLCIGITVAGRTYYRATFTHEREALYSHSGLYSTVSR